MGTREPIPSVSPNPSQYVLSWTLKNGTPVAIRPIGPDDAPLMGSHFNESLSDRTVYMRYFCSMSFAARTAHDRLLRICHSYSESELVLVGEGKDQESGERRILGVGRLIGYRQMARAEVRGRRLGVSTSSRDLGQNWSASLSKPLGRRNYAASWLRC